MRTHLAALTAGLCLLALLAPELTRAEERTAFVLEGPEGRPILRAITDAAACPKARIDGRTLRLTLRAPPGAAHSAAATDTAAQTSFPDRVCETQLHAGVRSLRLWNRALPVPRAEPRRIVVIGDTGCRIKASDDAAQACNDPKAYPFAQIARSAAAMKPDLIIHVGDYLYRETPCPADAAGCRGSPSGYGAAAWNADFLAPAAPLFAAAPLILARGNHETCQRAGEGWWRYLDPHPLLSGEDCADARAEAANHGAPYAVPAGSGLQFLILDSSAAANRALAEDAPDALLFARDRRLIEALAARTPHAVLIDHHPFLAYAAVKGGSGAPRIVGGNLSLQSVFGRNAPRLLPEPVGLILSGHVHVFEQTSFQGDFPTQIVAGFSGTAEDLVPLPLAPPQDLDPAPGAKVAAMSSWIDGFGFLTLDRTGPDRFRVAVRDVTGRVVRRCVIDGRTSTCGPGPNRGPMTPPAAEAAGSF